MNTMVFVNQLLSTNAIVRVKDGDNNVDNVDTTAITTTTINGVTITDNGDVTYAYSLPTATGGVETVGDNGSGAAVVNFYTAGGALAGSETTGFDADSCKRYEDRSCLRTYLLGYGTKRPD